MKGKKHLVVLTGAGISADSGLKTFRDSDGLWNGYDIEDVATPSAWQRNPALVLEFYNHRRRDVLNASPNAAHLGLASLENDFDITIITQNIDDLHERGGSTRIVHLHGEILKMRSEKNSELIAEITGDIQLGDMAEDGAQWRPHIVWFGEMVPMIEVAANIASTADIFVVIGTSLAVYPAAGLVHYAPAHCPKFILDRRIPDAQGLGGFKAIEKPAAEGISTLISMLKNISA
jgi:NAD-dependent deacetylase